ncbi:sugar phosphate nucleotidyltransferase [Acidovorax sp. RAC01]|uniref:sugar phosphate nucleotidyltransferase n=1 Tax=Acidovorax sp. RAC01 TaxID=1842533 RepID=UPI00085891C2|nr:nucleotidyl transferase family protein [Acidovorax sp. RAC01]
MSRTRNVLAIVMAGGEGSRLHPLTAERCKPAVPFNGKHRIVDFVLSNLVNSEIYSIYLLVQYKSQSLIEHVRSSWTMTRFIPEHFVTVVPPQMRNGPEWFQGTADSVYQNIHLIESFRPDIVAVFGADHIYRMDVRQMVDFHRTHNAHVSVATLPVPLALCNQFGIVETDARHRTCPTANGLSMPAPTRQSRRKSRMACCTARWSVRAAWWTAPRSTTPCCGDRWWSSAMRNWSTAS